MHNSPSNPEFFELISREKKKNVVGLYRKYNNSLTKENDIYL